MTQLKVKINKQIDQIFSGGQGKLIKRAIIKSVELSPSLSISILKIGNETSVLLTGIDDNDHLHYAMLSEASFKQLKTIKL